VSSQDHVTSERLRTPRAAALAGIVFAALLTAALTLITVSTPSGATRNIDEWLTDPQRRRAVAVALGMVPFAGIAFLWFMGVVRDRLGDREDKFFATVFLGSGLLFVAMLFVAAALGGGLLDLVNSSSPGSSLLSTLAAPRRITWILVHIYMMRMAAVFTMSTAVLALRIGFAPRWIARLGVATAVILLVSVGLSPWVELLFPAWILLLSIDILLRSLRASPAPPTPA
jgi:hypothetical protein